MKISLVIPTLNAEKEIAELLDALIAQTVSPDEILVVDSSSDDDTQEIVKGYAHKGVRLMIIERKDFNHGGTRHMAVGKTTGDLILFMTQDALPADTTYIEKLIAPFADSKVAMTYGRQIPKPDARRFVQLVQELNYPEESSVRTIIDIDRMGVKAFFCSDVCSAYRRTAYQTVGGFDCKLNTNEDMLICSRFLKTGWAVAYVSNAKVRHSHNFTVVQQYRRNCEIGKFMALHQKDLNVASEVHEGIVLVQKVSKVLLDEHKYGELFAFGIDCIARLAGNYAGKKKVYSEVQ